MINVGEPASLHVFSSEHVPAGTVFFISPRRIVENEPEPFSDWVKRCAVIRNIGGGEKEMIGDTAPERRKANCDQEAWLVARLETAIKMALSLGRERRVYADDPSFEGAIFGLINGTALEIINLLNMEPSYANLARPRHLNRYDPKAGEAVPG